MSTPMLATVGLFVAVAQWSAWQDTLYYVTNPNLESLQFVLMKVLRQAEATEMCIRDRCSIPEKRWGLWPAGSRYKGVTKRGGGDPSQGSPPFFRAFFHQMWYTEKTEKREFQLRYQQDVYKGQG